MFHVTVNMARFYISFRKKMCLYGGLFIWSIYIKLVFFFSSNIAYLRLNYIEIKIRIKSKTLV